METTTKTCTKCKIEKSINEFHKQKDKKDGLRAHCKKCIALFATNNKDKIAEQRRNHYALNNEYMVNKRRAYVTKNATSISQKQKEYISANKERITLNQKQYYKNNKDKFFVKKREYYEKNKQKILKANKEYLKTIIGKLSRLNTEHKRRTSIKNGDVSNKQLGTLYSSTKTCYWCNDKLMKGDTHLDHYHPLSKGGQHTISNLVLSCSKCNLKKSAKDPLLFAQEMGRLL